MPQRLDAGGVCAQPAERQVDILAFDFFAEGEGERLLDAFGVFCAADGAQGGVALVAGVGGAVEV